MIYPESVDLGYSGIGLKKQHTFVFHNEGSAACDYQIIPGWDYNGNVFLENESLLKGRIPPDASQECVVVFQPSEVIVYQTEITIKTRLGEKQIKVLGIGIIHLLLNNWFYLLLTQAQSINSSWVVYLTL
jgi:hypothetical protein